MDGSFISARLKSARKHVDQPQKPEMSTLQRPLFATGESEGPTNHGSPKNVEITEK